MRARLQAALAILALVASLATIGVIGASTASATVAPCSSSYDELVWSDVRTSHTIRLYHNTGHSGWCASINATGALYGVPHQMGIIIATDWGGSNSYDDDGGNYAYYAGPVTINYLNDKISPSCGLGSNVGVEFSYTGSGGGSFGGGSPNFCRTY